MEKGLLYVIPIMFLVIGVISTIYPKKACMFLRKHMTLQKSPVNNTSKILFRIAGIITIFLSVLIFVITTIVILNNG